MGAFWSVGAVALILGYTLSQFYRAFLAVLTPVLRTEIGATAGDLALSSGVWFLTFALMQIPVGWALDRFGPRRVVAGLLAAGGGAGAAVFALATAPWHLHLAMALIGIGCSPALMGAYYIFAHSYPKAMFGTLAGGIVGFGSAGNILGAAPLVWVIDAAGWRPTLWGLVAATLIVAVLIGASVRDPVRAAPDAHAPQGSLVEILRLRALWFILPLFFVNYAACAAIRGLWAGPYLKDVFGADAAAIGRATLVMGGAMIVGNFLAGPVARALRSARRAALALTGLTVAALAVLALWPALPQAGAVAMLALIGLSGAGYTLLMMHGRSFLPPHLVGRGVTFLNMISIGGAGVMQFGSRPFHAWAMAGRSPAEGFGWLFAFFLIPLIAGMALYLLTPEAPHD